MSSTPPKHPEEALGESWVDLTMQTTSPRRSTPPLPLGSEEYLRLLREAQRESNNTSTRGSLASSRRDTPRECISPKSPPNSPNPEFATDLEELRDYYLNKGDPLACAAPAPAAAVTAEAPAAEKAAPTAQVEGARPWSPDLTAACVAVFQEDCLGLENTTDWVWDWSSRPDLTPPKCLYPVYSASAPASPGSLLSLLGPGRSLLSSFCTRDWRFRNTATKRSLSMRTAKVGSTGVFSRGVLATFIVTNILSLLIGCGIGYWMSKKTVVLQLVPLD